MFVNVDGDSFDIYLLLTKEFVSLTVEYRIPLESEHIVTGGPSINGCLFVNILL